VDKRNLQAGVSGRPSVVARGTDELYRRSLSVGARGLMRATEIRVFLLVRGWLGTATQTRSPAGSASFASVYTGSIE
jgi:hypothetical protein